MNLNSCDRVSLSILHPSTCLNQVVNDPIEDVSCSIRRWRWRWSAGTGGRPGWVRGRVTVGLSKGKGSEVYCVMKCRVCSRVGVYTGGVESPRMWAVAYCGAGQETHSWRILSCPPDSGATMADQDCNETT